MNIGSKKNATRLFAMALWAFATVAFTQDYPARPVKIVAPSTPGGGFDLVGRVLAQKLGEQSGQQFVVENRAGAGTLVGSQAVARASPDGYTLLVGGLSNIALNMGLYKQPGYDSLVDFTVIGLVVSHSYTLIARKDLPLSSIREIISFARTNPGKLTFATGGAGSGQHLGAALIAAEAQVKSQTGNQGNILLVPYKGAQPVYQDLLAGRVDLFFDNTTTTKAYIDAGQVKPIAISSRQRSASLPQLPTLIESGVLDLEMETWFGLFAPARTPRPIVDRLRAEVDKAVQSAEVRSRLEQGSGRSLRMTPSETEIFVKAEVAKWTGLVRKAGASAD